MADEERVRSQREPSLLTEEEWTRLKGISNASLVDLAADLDLVVPSEIDKRWLIDQCVQAIVTRGAREGLPFSKYDREDLEALPPDLLQAIAGLQQTRATVSAILGVGARVYKTYEQTRPDNPMALMLPSLLIPVARYARDQQILPPTPARGGPLEAIRRLLGRGRQ